MQGSLNSTQSINRPWWSNSVLPPVLWSLPVICAGFFGSMIVSVSGAASEFFLGLLGLLYLFWLICVFQIHLVLARETNNLHPVKPGSALLLNLLAGPVAAFVASQICTSATRIALQLDDLVAEVMPNCLPIAHSAVMLLQHYGVYLAVAMACVAGVFFQMKAVKYLRRFVESRSEWTGRNLTPLAAAVLGVSLVAPGCLWLLGTASTAPHWAQALDSRQGIYMLAFACCFLAFGILGLINKQIAQAVKTRQVESQV
jgi:hypothetical protein